MDSSAEPTSPATPAGTSPAGAPADGAGDPATALPSVLARVMAFLAVFIGAAAGGFIGYAFGSLGGFSSLMTGVLTLATGLGFAAGVAVVAVLTLRALGEWNTIRAQGPQAMAAARAARSGPARS